ncbi:MAG: hypothetical protein QNK23_07880 [Crocinitomicaceae bacterium]|nr:hypothetical protein [Crocinitomicaceae bacterium]
MRLLIIFVFGAFGLSAQVGTGQWRMHVPASKSIDVVSLGSKIFTAYEFGVSEYDVHNNETALWDAVNGLSDVAISCLGYSPSNNSVFVGYENGNLDKIKDNRVTNIPAINLAQIQGSKKINSIVAHGDYVYLATGFAIVKIDPTKDEVRDTYYPTNGTAPINDLCFRNDSIFAISTDRMYVGLINNPALADPTQWTEDARVEVLFIDEYKNIVTVGDEIYFSLIAAGWSGVDTVYRLTETSMDTAFTETFNSDIRSVQEVNGMLVVNYYDASKLYNSDLSVSNLLYTYTFDGVRPNAITINNGKYYVADDRYGLVELNGLSGTRISITGPPKSNFYAMDWNSGRLAVAGGGLSGIFQTYNTSGAYVFEDEGWSLYDNSTLSKWNGAEVYDVLGVSVNPANEDEIAIGSFSEIPVTIVNRSGDHDTLTPVNSGLEYHSNNQGGTFVSDLAYDDMGNLWVVNGHCNNALKVYTADGEWYSMYTGGSTINKFTKKIVIDNNDNKWFLARNVGVIGFNDNGTISSPSDDEYVVLNSGEYTGALPSNEINAIAVDLDDEIWIGTDNGFAVLYNSSSAFGAAAGEYNAQRIKLEFEGNVEYVLGSTNITDIEVDGANRKWFATSNAGVILLSEDGLEIIEQHTIENSPLPSNNIMDIELDQQTGELYIITDQGLISYRTDATQGTRNYDNVTVFPNPARPDYDGPITIQGIKYDSDVKITDIAGNLVYKTTSNGGTATWDGRTLQGERVSTGVYLIWTAPNDDETKGRKVGKVLVVN